MDNKTSIFTPFIGQYPVSKTLRFELKPIGKTLEHITKEGLLQHDEKRAEDYKVAKTIIDNYHRHFIETVLSKASFDWKDLKAGIDAYKKKEIDSAKLEKIQDKYRGQIQQYFKDDERYKVLMAPTPKDLFKELLPDFFASHPENKENEQAVETFKSFATYFQGFQENRRNVYSSEAIPTAVPYRIVHDNFPKFLQNMTTYNYLQENCPEVLAETEKELSDKLSGKTLKEIFSLDGFNSVLAQNGIDFYNQIIGGVAEAPGQKKLRGLNEFINLYWQQHKEFASNHHRVKMIVLFKQILSDRSTMSFVLNAMENDSHVKSGIQDFYYTLAQEEQIEDKEISFFDSCNSFMDTFEAADMDKVYISAKDLTFVSQVLFGRWDELQIRMNAYARHTFTDKNSKARWIKDISENTSVKRKGEFSIKELDEALSFVCDDVEPTDIRIKDYFSARYKTKQDETIFKQEIAYLSFTDAVQHIKNLWNEIQPILDTLADDSHIRENPDDIDRLKQFLDSCQDLLHRLKPFNVSFDVDKDTVFYSLFDFMYGKISEIIPLYNRVRNYVTKKQLSAGKYKLMFENPTLANGWDYNKENDNTCILLRKDGKYYLGIMNAKRKPNFKDKHFETESIPCYEKMIYKLLPGPNKMLPKVFFSEKNKTVFNPTNEILSGYEQGQHKKGDTFNKQFCHTLIDYFKDSIDIHEDWKNFNFQFSDTENYPDISIFYKEVADQGYKITFVNIPVSYIDSLVENGSLYLFQIYNKDFASGAKGKKNLHTMYWDALFTKENLSDVVLKLNGEAELFYREASIKKPVLHRSGEKVVNRTLSDGTSMSETVHDELFKFYNNRLGKDLSREAQDFVDSGKVTVNTVRYDIVKDRHYTEPKFLFHVPITLNFKADGKNEYLNERVRRFLKQNPDVNIIGLDRGERNLLYISIINQKGEILRQYSFNKVAQERLFVSEDKTITTKKVQVDYHDKLDVREKEREAARKNWQTIGKIAELKEGYLSAVIHELCTLMIQYNAIIVMEDLNFGFKRGRFKVEKQIYQKFEHMLIDKLNYLVFKDKGLQEPGGVLKGYQLAEKFESFPKLGKQSGFIFYIPAGYTSKIDPVTGFVNLFDLKGLTNTQKKREFFEKFEEIRYEPESDMFRFTFDYKDFLGKDAQKPKKTKWTVYSNDKRIKYDVKTKGYQDVIVTENLRKLFTAMSIPWEQGENLFDAIMAYGAGKEETKDRETIRFFDELYRNFVLVIQLRNSNNHTDEDFILSPVKDSAGNFFDSRKQMELGDKAKLPKDADANGAYHIALKGLYLLQLFDGTEEDKLKKIDMKISNTEWFDFRQK